MNKQQLRSLGLGFLASSIVTGAFAIFLQGNSPVAGQTVGSLFNQADNTAELRSLQADKEALESTKNVLNENINSLIEKNESQDKLIKSLEKQRQSSSSSRRGQQNRSSTRTQSSSQDETDNQASQDEAANQAYTTPADSTNYEADTSTEYTGEANYTANYAEEAADYTEETTDTSYDSSTPAYSRPGMAPGEVEADGDAQARADSADVQASYTVPMGANSVEIAQGLEAAGIVDSAAEMEYFFEYYGLTTILQAGTYNLHSNMTMDEIAWILTHGVFQGS